MNLPWPRALLGKFNRNTITAVLVPSLMIVLAGGYLVYAQTSGVIRSNIYVGNIHVGGMTREQARNALADGTAEDDERVVTLIVEQQPFPISASDIDLRNDIEGAVEKAWSIGRSRNPLRNITSLIRLPFTTIPIPIDERFDHDLLALEIETIAELVDQPKKDIRLSITDGAATILTDTKTGLVLDQPAAKKAVADAIAGHRPQTDSLTRMVDEPRVTLVSAEAALEQAQRVLDGNLTLTHDLSDFTITVERIGSWLFNNPSGDVLLLDFDEAAIGSYVTTIAERLDAEPRSPEVTLEDGKVVEFTAPQTGRTLDQDATIAHIIEHLTQRAEGARGEEPEDGESIQLAVTVERPAIIDASAADLGITELIGSASTRFTGSPPNRISNIKNGVKFLSGILIPPGEEFSTITALGTIDNTTGYLPELVIKENRTIPEYGGGLCQVSTTLFRATMNSALPITARRNHSYRVSYYEVDGEGHYIGPGLDATIYSPNPDFRFFNDTAHHILIQGHVDGDKITFDFYGTRDGRSSHIDGPHTIATTGAGEPIYVETDEIPPGEERQIERAHAGGTAVATYTITYADGTEKEEKYTSLYRSWPAQYLVGVDPSDLEGGEQEAGSEEVEGSAENQPSE